MLPGEREEAHQAGYTRGIPSTRVRRRKISFRRCSIPILSDGFDGTIRLVQGCLEKEKGY
jgi:hypothetical protein